MTRASSGLGCRRPLAKRRFWRSGFSLVEVVIATGLCTYALVVIACLLPMGMGTVQIANAQIIQTEIFNRIWLEVNTIPFYALPDYPRFKNGTPAGNTPYSGGATGLSYFDKDGGELPAASGASAVYKVYCALIYPGAANLPSSLPANLITRLPTLGPPVDGIGTSALTVASATKAGSGLNLVKIAIGFHVDPSSAGLSATDPRIASRTYVIAKRDTYNGN